MGPQTALAADYARMGKTKEARKILPLLENPPHGRYVSPLWIAVVYCSLGEKDSALKWVRKAIEQRDVNVVDLSTLPGLELLRSDPRFADLLKKVGLVQ